jgi:hypothetical protein
MKVIKFGQGDCKTIRSYMDSYMNDELLVETNHEVLKHLETCKDCATELESRMRVQRVLQKAVKKDVAPAGLQYRIQRDIRKQQQPTSGYQWRNWVLAAAAMFIVAVGSWGAFKAIKSNETQTLERANQQDVEILTVGVNNHLHCAIDRQFANKHFTDEEMNMKLGPEFIGLVSLVKDKVPGSFEVVVGHRCSFKKREYIHLILKDQNKVMSLVLTRKNGEAFAKTALGNVIEAAGIRMHSDHLDDYEVTGFETPDYFAFVVSNMDKQENEIIATNLAPALRAYLAKMES